MRSGVMRRETLWLGVAPTRTVMAAANTAALVNSGGAGVLALRPFTVVRTRGVMNVSSDQTAALEFYHAALGYAVVSDQAVAIGVTAVPTPHTDFDSDLWFTYEDAGSEFTFVSGIGINADAGVFRTYDSKAMRKVEEGEQIITVIETSGISSGARLFNSARILVKLH